MDLSHTFAVILAGGSGTRFWPRSRVKSPKQLLCLGDKERSMLEMTLDRLDGFIPPERRIIVTNQEQVQATREISKKKCSHVIAEPFGRNTAAAITLGALEIWHLSGFNPEATMISLHSDHFISPVETFHENLHKALMTASENFLTLLGVKPTFPATGYGYIEKGETLNPSNQAFHIKEFKEKPPLDKAKDFLAAGQYLWNSGLFCWKVSTLLEEVKKYIPDTYQVLDQQFGKHSQAPSKTSEEDLHTTYNKLSSISIDEGLLEKSPHIAVVTATFQWTDCGSWSQLGEIFPPDQEGNLVFGKGLLLKTKNSVIDSKKHFVAAIGLDNIAVIVTDDAVLVCNKEQAQEVKSVVPYLKEHGLEKLT